MNAAVLSGAAAAAAVLLRFFAVQKMVHESHWLRVRQRGTCEPEKKVSALQRKAMQAGLEIPASHLVLIGLAGAALGAGVAAAVTGKVTIALAGAALGAFAPVAWVNRKVQGRALLFEAQFEMVLGHMAASIRAGQTVQQALEQAALGAISPAQDVLSRAVLYMRSGHTVVDALEQAGNTVNSRDLKVAAAAIGLHTQAGGDLALNLDQIADGIRDRRAFRSQVGAAVSEGVLTSNILVILPLIAVGGMRALNPGYMAPLFNTSQGMLVLAVCSAAILFGWLVIRRIVTIQY